MDKRRLRWCLFRNITAVVANVGAIILHLCGGRWLLLVLHLVLIIVVIWSFVRAWRNFL